MLGIMQTVYVMTGKDILKKMVRYWGILFGINFVLGYLPDLPWNFNLVLIGHITPIMLVTYLGSAWYWKGKAFCGMIVFALLFNHGLFFLQKQFYPFD
jgi:hypothetical protein